MNNLTVKKFNCTGCGLCNNICPTKAIKIKLDKEGFYHFQINKEKCIECGLCIKKCPKLNFKNKNKIEELKSYAAYTKNEIILADSSSGGIFSELALQIVKENGLVVGASYEDNSNEIKVKHILVDNIDDLTKLRGSKYIQSYTDNIYKLVMEQLSQNKKVLFSGTPCQCAAMRIMAEKKDDNLIVVDIVCHGVPSYKVFTKFLKDCFNKKITKINFRNKSKGWSQYKILYYIDNKIIKSTIHTNDEFFGGFVKNYYLMKNCYNCEFSNIPRVGDITLGDFWGIQYFDKKFSLENKDRGISLVYINNDKGMQYFNKIKENIIYKEEPFEISYSRNSRAHSGKYAEQMLKNRIFFFNKDYNTSFKKRRYVRSFRERMLSKIKSPLIRLKSYLVKLKNNRR